MECREIREIISAYVDGEALPEEARRVEEHLGGCAECRTAEKRMRVLGVSVTRTEGAVPPDFRENLFARLEKEDLLPKRRSIFVYSLRWAAVPLAAAAALALFLLSSREPVRDLSPTALRPPQVSATGEQLSPEDREIVANLEVLEDPDLFDEPEIEEMEIFIPSSQQRG
ncbi:MAG: zf-HC2 domain-containing protein [Deltaproteobacteria bacterium]|nr:zf-HC2 domain-containing protein [Deltaproteobacteria bacterium]